MLCVGDREARADCQCGELIDRIAASAPVRELLFVEALGHTRVPFAGSRPDHRAGVELATIDAHRAAKAAADPERRLDNGVARQARRDRFEISDFAGRAAAGHSKKGSPGQQRGSSSSPVYIERASNLILLCVINRKYHYDPRAIGLLPPGSISTEASAKNLPAACSERPR